MSCFPNQSTNPLGTPKNATRQRTRGVCTHRLRRSRFLGCSVCTPRRLPREGEGWEGSRHQMPAGRLISLPASLHGRTAVPGEAIGATLRGEPADGPMALTFSAVSFPAPLSVRERAQPCGPSLEGLACGKGEGSGGARRAERVRRPRGPCPQKSASGRALARSAHPGDPLK